MKNIIFYPFIVAFLCISCDPQSSDLDAIVLQCYDSKYKEEGFEIKTVIDDYEKVLVQEGVLKDGSGKSYLEVWQRINSDPDFRIKAPTFEQYDPWHQVDKETAVAVYQCEFEKIESLKVADSRWEQVFSTSKSAESANNPKQVYRTMIENLSDTDFNSYYFRLKMFQLFDMVNLNKELGL